VEQWEVEARESIRDLVARYNAKGDSGRFDEMLALFADDAVMVTPSKTCTGSSEIRDFFQTVASGTDSSGAGRARFVRHFTSTHQIDLLDQYNARGRAYYLVLTERGLDHWGLYVDEYRRVGERWRFARRKATLEGAIPGGWGDQTQSDHEAR
jgi:3-phenylpropionate/cinnamic acid dioxygenase small subunit